MVSASAEGGPFQNQDCVEDGGCAWNHTTQQDPAHYQTLGEDFVFRFLAECGPSPETSSKIDGLS